MKIILTEQQLKNITDLLLKEHSDNFKPAHFFDSLYGTSLGESYDFSPYTEDELWEEWVNCRSYWLECDNCEECRKFEDSFKLLPKLFPQLDITKYDIDTKKDLMLGALSGFNFDDIEHFAIKRIPAFKNIEQKELQNQLPYEISRNIQWVLSPKSMEQIKMKFGII